MGRLEIEDVAKKRIEGVLPEKYQMPGRSGLLHWRTEPSEERKDFLAWQERQHRKLIKRLLCVAAVLVVLFSLAAWRGRNINKEYMDINAITSYGQLYKHYMGLLEKPDYFSEGVNLSAVMKSSGAGELSGAVSAAAGATEDFTAMNTREEAIGEADYAVTDGKYIYGLSYIHHEGEEREDGFIEMDYYTAWLHVIKPDGEDAEEIASLCLPVPSGNQKEEQLKIWRTEGEVYVKGNALVVMQQLCGSIIYDQRTALLFYDISNPASPQLIKSNVQYGSYNTSRESEGVLYVVTKRQNAPLTAEMKEEQGERYIPIIDGKALEVQDIYMQEDSQGNSYSIISSWSLEQGGKRLDAKALIGYYSDIYMTKENLYASNSVYLDRTRAVKKAKNLETDYTRITKFSLRNGEIKGQAMTQIPGFVTNSFGIQERGDKLYIVAQVWHYKYNKHENYYMYKMQDIGVYTLDDKLNRIGCLEGLAAGEDVKAVRFVQDICYLVSYEQTDPLFCIDLSDPSQPKVMDEIKMPGYSAYLHPVADNMLLGIGWNDEGNQVKLALYDISDIKKLKECDVKRIDFEWVCGNLGDYRKIFIDEENQIVGLRGGTGDVEHRESYVLYHYGTDGTLEKKKDYKLEFRKLDSGFDIEDGIGMRIGSYFYIINKYEAYEEKNINLAEALYSFPYSIN